MILPDINFEKVTSVTGYNDTHGRHLIKKTQINRCFRNLLPFFCLNKCAIHILSTVPRYSRIDVSRKNETKWFSRRYNLWTISKDRMFALVFVYPKVCTYIGTYTGQSG